MPNLPADPIDVICLGDHLRQHAELDHLRVRKRGALLIIESGSPKDTVAHVRFRRVTKQWWTPEMPSHLGVWSPLPARLPLGKAFELIRTDFPWLLTPRD